jgi:hypothetical protein
MIHPYDNSTQTRWDLGEFKVQLNQPNNPRPFGFCDGSPEDVTVLLSLAEAEGVDDIETTRRSSRPGAIYGPWVDKRTPAFNNLFSVMQAENRRTVQ